MKVQAAQALEVGQAYRLTCKRPRGKHEHIWEGRYVGMKETGYATDGPKIVLRPLDPNGPMFVNIPPSFVRSIEEL